jgi:hypothetical protein
MFVQRRDTDRYVENIVEKTEFKAIAIRFSENILKCAHEERKQHKI